MKRLLTAISEAWLILALAGVFGGALASVHGGLAERIEANKRAETLRQVPAILLGPAATLGAEISIAGQRIEIAGEPTRALEVRERELSGYAVLEVRKAAGDALAGWVIKGSGQGYADTIELLVGLSPDATTLTGLYVLAQKETPALGDGITRQEFRGRFVGRSTSEPLTAVAGAAGGPGRIQALTAATISSESVCDIVNRTVAEVGPALRSANEERGSEG